MSPLSLCVISMKETKRPPTSLRFQKVVTQRAEELSIAEGVTKAEVYDRLLLLGLERVDAGEPLFGTRPYQTITSAIARIEEALDAGRARETNLGLDTMETVLWLRTIGDILKPGLTEEIKALYQKTVDKRLNSFEQLPKRLSAQKS